MSDTETIIKERAEARARVEIITPSKNNLVAEYFSSSSTPETDAETNYCDAMPDMPWVDAEVARKLERERDEAREDAEHWKTEYEIVVARLCGKKHPRDNGIFSEHEIIPKLERERNEAILVMRETRRRLDDAWLEIERLKNP